MKKIRIVFAAAMVLLLVTGTPTVYSIGFEQDINYYDDDAFLDWNGNHFIDCEGNEYDTGTLGSWRVFDLYSCSTGNRIIHRCQQTDGMGGWINLACPPNQP